MINPPKSTEVPLLALPNPPSATIPTVEAEIKQDTISKSDDTATTTIETLQISQI
jgi:hypothetical protein